VAAVGWLKYVYLAGASQPKAERTLYRLVKRHKVCRIVEVGIGRIERSALLVEVAQRYARGQAVAYTGLDWFESRSKEMPALSLKEAHRRLQTTGASARLVPGPPARSLAAVANAHRGTGLLLISAAVADDDLATSWFYVPRMLTPQSVVLREARDAAGQPAFTRLSLDRIAQLVNQTGTRRAA
jgi:hypothetical protein